jgi:TPR repeat protein
MILKAILMASFLCATLQLHAELSDSFEQIKAKAKAGDIDAQRHMAKMYGTGLGVETNFVEAVKWARKAAEQGYSGAQVNLGHCYEMGQGVPQDYVEAVRWYRKAAGHGLPEAQHNLAGCFANGQEAVKWFLKAAEQGNVVAQHALGRVYYAGDSSLKDYTQAFKWLSLAAAQGSKESAQMLEELKVFMNSKEISESQRLVKEFQPHKTQSGTTTSEPFREFVPVKEKVKPGSSSK